MEFPKDLYWDRCFQFVYKISGTKGKQQSSLGAQHIYRSSAGGINLFRIEKKSRYILIYLFILFHFFLLHKYAFKVSISAHIHVTLLISILPPSCCFFPFFLLSLPSFVSLIQNLHLKFFANGAKHFCFFPCTFW